MTSDEVLPLYAAVFERYDSVNGHTLGVVSAKEQEAWSNRQPRQLGFEVSEIQNPTNPGAEPHYPGAKQVECGAEGVGCTKAQQGRKAGTEFCTVRILILHDTQQRKSGHIGHPFQHHRRTTAYTAGAVLLPRA